VRFVICLVIACGPATKARVYYPDEAPPVEQPVERPVEPPQPGQPKPAPAARPAIARLAVGPAPTSIVVHGTTLFWSDSAGSIWSMPSTGGTPRQRSSQRSPDFAFKLVTAGDSVIASTRKDLLLVGETVTKLNIRGLVEYPEEIVADEAFVYVTMFKRNEIMRIPVSAACGAVVGGCPAVKLGELPRGVLALGKDTLYAVSYSTGALVAIPKAGGKPRTVAKGLVRPTALAADDTHVFVYSEQAKTLSAIDLATGAANVIARDLTNSDELVADGSWLYTRSWDQGNTGSLVRIAKDGSSRTALATDLAAPYNIAVDGDAVFVTARDGAQIVRFEKAALAP
jgi:hypothetical protein